MHLKRKINTIIKEKKLNIENRANDGRRGPYGEKSRIRYWRTSNYNPCAMSIVRLNYKDATGKTLMAYLKIDLMILGATQQECIEINSQYVWKIRQKYGTAGCLQQEWVNKFNEREERFAV